MDLQTQKRIDAIDANIKRIQARLTPEKHPEYRDGHTLEAYQRLAMRTRNPSVVGRDMGINAALGLVGEAGEFADQLKKELYHGHTTDDDKLERELGDVLWYIALACEYLGVSMGDVARKNIDKLKARYPDAFSTERSENKDERTE